LRFGRRLEGRRAWLALGISTTGVALAVGGIPRTGGPPLLGLALAVASPIIYSVWIVMAARLGGERRDRLPQGADVAARATAMRGTSAASAMPPQDAEAAPSGETESAPAAALMTTASAAVFFLGMLATGRSVAPASIPGGAWLGLIGVAGVSTALALQAFYAGARRVGAARASLISTVEPIYTIVLASLLFHESLAPIQLMGGALIIGGVLLAESGQGGESVGGEPVGGEPVGGEPVGGEPVGGEPVGGESVGGEPVGGEPVGGESVGGEPVGGEPVGGESVGREPVGGEPVGGEPVGGESVGGDQPPGTEAFNSA
jgi:drug/metabolite transporter (DMT)-like permease